VPESNFKVELGRGLAYDARVERAIAAIDRMAEAQYQLRLILMALAYPDSSSRPLVQKPGKIEVSLADAAPAPAPNRPARPAPAPTPPSALDEAIRAERVAAAAEVLAEDRERQARASMKAADEAYRAAAPGDRLRARDAWASAREEWELARRDWVDARENWLSAKHQLEAARPAAAPPVANTSAPGDPAVSAPGDPVDLYPTPSASRPAPRPATQIVVNSPAANTTAPRIGSTVAPRAGNTSVQPAGITPGAPRSGTNPNGSSSRVIRQK